MCTKQHLQFWTLSIFGTNWSLPWEGVAHSMIFDLNLYVWGCTKHFQNRVLEPYGTHGKHDYETYHYHFLLHSNQSNLCKKICWFLHWCDPCIFKVIKLWIWNKTAKIWHILLCPLYSSSLASFSSFFWFQWHKWSLAYCSWGQCSILHVCWVSKTTITTSSQWTPHIVPHGFTRMDPRPAVRPAEGPNLFHWKNVKLEVLSCCTKFHEPHVVSEYAHF